jgi:hypothetical protein
MKSMFRDLIRLSFLMSFALLYVSENANASRVGLPSRDYTDCSAINLKIESVEDFFGLSWSLSYKTHALGYQRISFDMFLDDKVDPNSRKGRLKGEVAGRSRCLIDIDTNMGRLHYKCGMPLREKINKFQKVLIAGVDYNKEKADTILQTLTDVWSTNSRIGDSIALSYTYKTGDDFFIFDEDIFAASGLKKFKSAYQAELHKIVDAMASIRACERSALTEEQLLLELQ